MKMFNLVNYSLMQKQDQVLIILILKHKLCGKVKLKVKMNKTIDNLQYNYKSHKQLQKIFKMKHKRTKITNSKLLIKIKINKQVIEKNFYSTAN